MSASSSLISPAQDHALAGARVRTAALFASVGLLVVGNGLQNTLVGLRAGLEGMPTVVVGFVMSAYFAGFVLGCVAIPHLVASVGHIRTFAALASTVSAVCLRYALAVHPAAWLVLRALHGACYAGLVVVVESWLNASTDNRTRGRTLALYMVVVYAGWAAGQPLLTLAAPDGFVLFALVSVLVSLAVVPISLGPRSNPACVTAARMGLGALLRISPVAVAGAFLAGLAMSALFGLAPAFSQALGFDDAVLASLVSLALVGALVAQWPVGWLSDRTDRRAVIACAACAATLAAGGVAAGADASLPALLALTALIGAAAMPIYSLCVAHANDLVAPEDLVAVASGLVVSYGIGSALGPLGAGVAMATLGPHGLFLFVSAAMSALALYATWRTTRTSAPRAGEKSGYVAVPQTSPAAAGMHRDAPEEARR
jgi:MFS family permease